ncbi:Mitochondrial intermediate peptidase, partial [Rhizophlyctis rosea]
MKSDSQKALKRVTNYPAISQSLSHEERAVASALINDFEKSGVGMPQSTRARFVDLNDKILALGQAFTEVSHPYVDHVEFDDPVKSLEGLPPPHIQHLMNNTKKKGKSNVAAVRTGSPLAYSVLRLAQREESRRAMYVALNSGSPRQLGLLEEMLRTRGELANLLGKESYGEMTLGDKMVQSPEHAMRFLESAAKSHRPLAESDLSILQNLKRRHTNNPSAQVEAWDQYFYTRFVSPSPSHSTDTSPSEPLTTSSLRPYFTIGNTFKGLSTLFQSLYGIRLEPSTTLLGETWHSEVRKLDVVHETEGKIGTIYCDLLQREDGGRKYDSAAHFTVRCSRLVTREEMRERRWEGDGFRNKEAEKVVEGGVKQLPVIVLVTDFVRSQGGGATLLSFEDVKTLFHEMGHAMHSMLARTDYQHIAGTRVQMDFVEVPSVFTEHFTSSPSFLATFARHHKTNEPAQITHLKSFLSCQQSQTFKALELQNQIQMALLDQLYHSSLATSPSFSTTQILKDLQNRVNVFP